MKTWILYLAAVNLLTFIVYGLDKYKAKRRLWRIPEHTLLLLAVIGGSPAALLGMQILRHKTKHPKFYIGIPVILFLQAAVIVGTCSF